MSKLNTAVVAALLALAVVLGSVAVGLTTGLGTAAQAANSASVATKTRQLNAYERKLQAQLAGTASAQQPRIVYHRPPPIVVVKHHSGDDGFEAQGSGGDD